MSEVGCVVGSLSGWVGSAFFARSSLMLVGTLEGVRSEVIAWFACDKASLRAQYEILFCNKELNLLLPGSGCPLQVGTGHGQSGRAPAVRTGSGQMRMCGDIFAAARLWRGRLLTTGHLS
jgi:hypothetical protein